MVSDLSKYIYLPVVYFGSVISFHFVGVQLAPETPSKEEILSSSTTVHADGPINPFLSVSPSMTLVAPSGKGKSADARHFCRVTGYQLHLFPLYKEMTATDLLW
jgi:hypothetical protein